jgi:hypothetical protein
MSVQSRYEPTEAASLADLRPVRLERSKSQQSEPMWMAFTRHRFAGTFAFAIRLRWSRKIGQVVKLGSPFEKDEPDDGETATVWRGLQGESCS